jgi:hypothetical protein
VPTPVRAPLPRLPHPRLQPGHSPQTSQVRHALIVPINRLPVLCLARVWLVRKSLLGH